MLRMIADRVAENDLQETDIEILTETITEASDTVGEGIWFTNQATAQGQEKSNILLPLDFDPSVDYHEYRIDVSTYRGSTQYEERMS